MDRHWEYHRSLDRLWSAAMDSRLKAIAACEWHFAAQMRDLVAQIDDVRRKLALEQARTQHTQLQLREVDELAERRGESTVTQ